MPTDLLSPTQEPLDDEAQPHAGAQLAPYDALVIGTGFGGSVVACRLAQAGLRVLVLERGRRYESNDFPALPAHDALLPDLTRWTWKHSHGLYDVQDLNELTTIQAAGLGGGSLIYANVHLRPPKSVFDDRWPKALRNGRALKPFYDLAAAMLDAAPFPAPAGAFPKVDALEKAAHGLGRANAFFSPPLAINRKTRTPNRHGKPQAKCSECGRCSTGCPDKAKNTLDLNYLAVAEELGAELRTLCEVITLRERDDGWDVVWLDHLAHGKREQLRVPHVFLCAGSVHSTRLLQRAKLRSANKPVQSRVGLGFYPNADALGVVFDTPNQLDPARGPAIMRSLVHWEQPRSAPSPSSDKAYANFFMIQDGGYSAQLDRLVGALAAPMWLGRNRLTNVPEDRPRPIKSSVAPPPPSSDLRSPLDGLLNAGAAKAKLAIPQAVAKDWSKSLQELAKPMLLAPVVERVVERIVESWLERAFPWRHFTRGGRVQLFMKGLSQRVIRHMYPTSVITEASMLALLTAAGLDRNALLQEVAGIGGERPQNRAVLLAMGRDLTPGVLLYDRARDAMVADLDLFNLAATYSAEERLMTDLATKLGGELRVNPAWSFLGKPVTVHAQGGCRMSDSPSEGVTDHTGKVHGCQGLYVIDGSIMATSVGVNPSATILAVAERSVLAFIRSLPGKQRWPRNDASLGSKLYREHWSHARAWAKRAATNKWAIEPPSVPHVPFKSEPLWLSFEEEMHGFVAPHEGSLQEQDAHYLKLESAGRLQHPLQLKLKLRAADLTSFFEDLTHRLELSGSVRIQLPGAHEPRDYDVERGHVELMVERHKPYGLHSRELREAQERATGMPYRTRRKPTASQRQRFMRYTLQLSDAGKLWELRGYKRLREDPGLDAWRDASTLFVQLREVAQGSAPSTAMDEWSGVVLGGAVHLEMTDFITKQLPSMEVGTSDPARRLWAISKFATFFFGTLQRVYAPEITDTIKMLFSAQASAIRYDARRGRS